MIYGMSGLPSGAENQQRGWIIHCTALILPANKYSKYGYSLSLFNGKDPLLLGCDHQIWWKFLLRLLRRDCSLMKGDKRIFHCKAKTSMKTPLNNGHSATACIWTSLPCMALRHYFHRKGSQSNFMGFIPQVKWSFWKTFIWRLLKPRKIIWLLLKEQLYTNWFGV